MSEHQLNKAVILERDRYGLEKRFAYRIREKNKGGVRTFKRNVQTPKQTTLMK